ncbi:DUF4186 family protein [Nostoc sp. NIES-3756]|uniref:DUF4186 family protein n=1 Tax=Nostoc sp. NIES-3756 TaxID=1751286 RepID=UPI001E5526C9|nr:DUF4186 family protein [Nostoc sp. NIES-3756]
MKAAKQFGQCRECGVELVDWKRVYKRNLIDATYTFQCLKTELFRHHMWHVEISQKAINHARRKGKIGLRVAAKKEIYKSVGLAEPRYIDGLQTPRDDSEKATAIHYAQHATACCCRKCIEYWHNIPVGHELTETELEYFTNLVILYIEERLSYLTENGEKVPRIRKITPEKSSKEDEKGKRSNGN